ncbi:hypothetical protein OG609_34845 [Streptomyces sp. NBC_01224]|uniref:hypothetical protein n=1 Tax=Streptomyces sp. NBC_01224 TaxID=2903783 RepID=UPI002E121801|nr:hypothetical protein OG609_34845 [Streptomyces sp. NBC_01224]
MSRVDAEEDEGFEEGAAPDDDPHQDVRVAAARRAAGANLLINLGSSFCPLCRTRGKEVSLAGSRTLFNNPRG